MTFLQPNPAGIPESMKVLGHWVYWRQEPNKSGKPTKVPYRVGLNKRASSTDSATWTTFSTTIAGMANGIYSHDGIGFMLSHSGQTFVDADHCLDPITHTIEVPWVAGLVAELNTYTEISPSGDGLHFWLLGTFIGHGHTKDFTDRDGTKLEIYCRGRYGTVTGVRFEGTPAEPRAIDTQALQGLHSRIKNGQLGPDADASDANDEKVPIVSNDEPRPDSDLLERLEAWGLVIESIENPYQGDTEVGVRYVLETCPFNVQHASSAVFDYPSGPVFSCFHDSCKQAGYAWRDLLNKFEPVTSGNPETSPFPVPKSSPFSDDELGSIFVQQYGQNLRFTRELERWYTWTGKAWAKDESVIDLARETCRECALQLEAVQKGKGKATCSARVILATERLARSDTRIAVSPAEWDADPWLLNVANGIVDLRTGRLMPHAREYLMAKTCSCELAPPGTPTPLWSAFLRRITDQNTDLENYLQRVAGYCLTGSTREQALFFAYGTGRNGKGVFKDTLMAILADYSKAASMQTFLASNTTSHPTDLAHLCGARFVTATENNKGDRWDESKILALTGDDPVTCRFMRKDFFTYQPAFKILVAANNKPSLRSINEAVRARLHLVPFTVCIPAAERDLELKNKLRAEWPAILAWAVRGCLQWQAQGLNPPEAVVSATNEYMTEQDVIGSWISANCELDKGAFTFTRALFADWKAWAEESNEYVGSEKAFSQNLKQVEGIRPKHTNLGNGFEGISLRPFSHRRGYEPPLDRNRWSRKMGEED